MLSNLVFLFIYFIFKCIPVSRLIYGTSTYYIHTLLSTRMSGNIIITQITWCFNPWMETDTRSKNSRIYFSVRKYLYCVIVFSKICFKTTKEGYSLEVYKYFLKYLYIWEISQTTSISFKLSRYCIMISRLTDTILKYLFL